MWFVFFHPLCKRASTCCALYVVQTTGNCGQPFRACCRDLCGLSHVRWVNRPWQVWVSWRSQAFGSKPMGHPSWSVGEFTTHFRLPNFTGDWDVYWGLTDLAFDPQPCGGEASHPVSFLDPFSVWWLDFNSTH